MELLILVTHAGAGTIFKPLARACARAGIEWGVFFTHEGVLLLRDSDVCESLESAQRAVACLDSWKRCMQETPCPVYAGSQTDNSILTGKAKRVISF